MLCPENATVTGFRGVPGATPNLTATAETGNPGTPVEVERSGLNANPVFHFTIPGSAQVSVGVVTTLNPGAQATVVDGDPDPFNVELNFGIPRGDPGLNGTGVVVNTVAYLRAAPNNGTATTLGCTTAGDGGGGLWRYDATSLAADNTGTVVRPTIIAANDPGRWLRVYDGRLNARWFGVHPSNDVITNTPLLLAALATLTSGAAFYIPAGEYKFYRGYAVDGGAPADSILADNITIYGDGNATIINGNPDGVVVPLADSVYNYNYNVFKATSRSGLVLRDMAFKGVCAPLWAISCTNITVSNISDNGLLTNASKYLRSFSLLFEGCNTVRVSGSYFNNIGFSIHTYRSAAGALNKDVVVSDCMFEHTVSAGNFTFAFPGGVYIYFVENIVVTGCSFRNIYSSVANGNAGTGMGYAIYEGDGWANPPVSVVITNNQITCEGKGSGNMTGIFINFAQHAVVDGNSITGGMDCRISTLSNGPAINNRVISNNVLRNVGIYATSTRSLGTPQDALLEPKPQNLSIIGNNIYNAKNPITLLSDAWGERFVIDNNTITSDANNALVAGIFILAPVHVNSGNDSTLYQRVVQHPRITNNIIIGGSGNGIRFGGYVVSPYVVGNTILDGNLSNTTTDSGAAGAAVYCTSYSHGIVFKGNYVGNTLTGGGKFTWALSNATSVASHIFKDIVDPQSNVCYGLLSGSYFRYPTSATAFGIFDLNTLEYIANSAFDSGGVPGWYCTRKYTRQLTEDASNTNTLTLNNATGFLAGDVVLLMKTANPVVPVEAISLSVPYTNTTYWHASTISSLSGANQIILADAIPAGDGTYTAATSVVLIARIKAAPAIAA